jgi:FAD:protein FMN transferase
MLKSKSNQFINLSALSFKNVQRFSHFAMGTTFEVFIQHKDALYAEQAALDAFKEIDKIEQSLSHYIQNSDIAKIRTLKSGASTRVTIDTMESLLHCRYLFEITDGLFDVTIGPLYKCWLNEDKTLKNPSAEDIARAQKRVGMNFLQLDPQKMTVHVLVDSIDLDLGGFGKGYAVDRAADLLEEWDITVALIHGGFSSIYAIGKPKRSRGWPLSITHPITNQLLGMVFLQNQAMSASGIQKGQHIVNPKTAKPVDANHAVWSIGKNAATVDGLTTAFMMMSTKDIQDICSAQNENSALIIKDTNEIENILFPLVKN